MNFSDIDLAQLHLEALFVRDENERLVCINEPEPTNPAPRFFMTRTTRGNIFSTRYDVPDDLADELCKLVADEPIVRDLRMPPRHEARYAELLVPHAPIVSIEAGPAYYLPRVDVPERVVMITAENGALLHGEFEWLQNDLAPYAPVAAVVEAGRAVSVCFSSRLTADVAEAGVHTQVAYRGRGYAPDVVRGWAAGVRAIGRLPLYSTSWSNRASQAVAWKVGAVQYAVDFSIT